jgi:hypothetical protein
MSAGALWCLLSLSYYIFFDDWNIMMMKRIFLMMLASFLTLSPVTVFAQSHHVAVAPADRYFGQMKMSILGIRNSLHDLDIDLANNPQDAEHVFDKAAWVEDAMHDWQAKFPQDPWIPKYAYALANLYAKVDTAQAQSRHAAAYEWAHSKYPNSEFALATSR